MADITSDIDTSDIVGNEQIDTGDVTTPFDDLIGVINDILNGARSFDQINLGSGSELTIASGAITCSGSVHSVDTEADAATDDLDTIHMVDGDFVFLRAASADREVTLKHGASIQTGDGTDVVLDNTMKTMLLLRSNGVNYVVGGAGRSYPEDYISGLAVHATSATAITVKPGKALTTDGSLMIVSTTDISITPAGMTADSWYEVRLVSGSSGVSAVLHKEGDTWTAPTGYASGYRVIGYARATSATEVDRFYTTLTDGPLRDVYFDEKYVFANKVNLTQDTDTEYNLQDELPTPSLRAVVFCQTSGDSPGDIKWKLPAGSQTHSLMIISEDLKNAIHTVLPVEPGSAGRKLIVRSDRDDDENFYGEVQGYTIDLREVGS